MDLREFPFHVIQACCHTCCPPVYSNKNITKQTRSIPITPLVTWSHWSFGRKQIASLTLDQTSHLSQSQTAFVSYKSWVHSSKHSTQTAELQRWCHFAFYLYFSVNYVSILHIFLTVSTCRNIILRDFLVLKVEFIYFVSYAGQVPAVHEISSITQDSGVRTAKVGGNITLQCLCQEDSVNFFFWYQHIESDAGRKQINTDGFLLRQFWYEASIISR